MEGRVIKTIALGIATYCLIALVAFDSILNPIAFMTGWSYRLGIPHWRLLIFASAAASSIVFLFPQSIPISLSCRVPAFVVLTMVLSIISVGYFANAIRKERLSEFHPDRYDDSSFFQSIQEAPREYQFFVHTLAMRNCVLYGWSYRTLSFYRIPLRADVGRPWIKRCSTDRK